MFCFYATRPDMEHKNPLFSCLASINLVTDRQTPHTVIDAVINGIQLSIMHMFESMPTVSIKYIEDYNLTHEQIAEIKSFKRIYTKPTSDIFNNIDTNVYISPAINTPRNTTGICKISYFAYPAVRMIDIYANKILKLSPDSASYINIKQTVSHEILHIHPIYGFSHNHCSNPDCIMFPTHNADTINESMHLCPECAKKLHRFNYDMKFRRKITNLAMYRTIYDIILEPYYRRYKDAKADSLPGIKTANFISREYMNFIKLYYRELWLSQYK